MGRRGPKPTPVERKRARGNPGRRPLPPAPRAGHVVAPAVKVPTTPRGMGKAGRAVWRRVWKAGSRWISPDSDAELVEMLARAADEREQLRAWLAAGGAERRWYTTNAGQVITHPAVTQLRALDEQVTRWLSLLGFSPSDRGRLGLTEVRAISALDEYRARAAARRTAPTDDPE